MTIDGVGYLVSLKLLAPRCSAVELAPAVEVKNAVSVEHSFQHFAGGDRKVRVFPFDPLSKCPVRLVKLVAPSKSMQALHGHGTKSPDDILNCRLVFASLAIRQLCLMQPPGDLLVNPNQPALVFLVGHLVAPPALLLAVLFLMYRHPAILSIVKRHYGGKTHHYGRVANLWGQQGMQSLWFSV